MHLVGPLHWIDKSPQLSSCPHLQADEISPEFDLLNPKVTLNDGVCCVVASSQRGDDFQAKAVGDSRGFLAWKT